MTKLIVLWSFEKLIQLNEFYLVKCYRKLSKFLELFFTYFYSVLSHISIFSKFPWKRKIFFNISHISCIYVQTSQPSWTLIFSGVKTFYHYILLTYEVIFSVVWNKFCLKCILFCTLALWTCVRYSQVLSSFFKLLE